MDIEQINHDLSELLQSKNGCEYSDVSDGLVDLIVKSKEVMLNVLHLNIRSFHKNSDSLTMLLSDLHDRGIVTQAVGLCETFLSDPSKVTAKLENYTPLHCYKLIRLEVGQAYSSMTVSSWLNRSLPPSIVTLNQYQQNSNTKERTSWWVNFTDLQTQMMLLLWIACMSSWKK